MDIICHDRTRDKLYFAAEFLAYLDRAAYRSGLALTPRQMQAYGAFLNHFPRVARLEQTVDFPQALHIVFSDDIQKARDEAFPPRTLIFPLLTPKQAEEAQTMDDARVIPLPLQAKSTLPLLVGDTLTACDMVEREMSGLPLKGKRILVSAGPTAEDIDPVRFITNRSSGKMGIALARAAFRLGAHVTLVLGPVKERVPLCLPVIPVRSAEEMATAVLDAFPRHDAYIAAAAVADFTPEQRAGHKIKKSQSGLSLRLKRTIDILEALEKRRQDQLVIGFSMETENLLPNSLQKLHKKNLDWIAANDPTEAGAGFAVDTNRIVLIGKNGEQIDLPRADKLNIADRLLRIVFNIQTA